MPHHTHTLTTLLLLALLTTCPLHAQIQSALPPDLASLPILRDLAALANSGGMAPSIHNGTHTIEGAFTIDLPLENLVTRLQTICQTSSLPYVDYPMEPRHTFHILTEHGPILCTLQRNLLVPQAATDAVLLIFPEQLNLQHRFPSQLQQLPELQTIHNTLPLYRHEMFLNGQNILSQIFIEENTTPSFHDYTIAKMQQAGWILLASYADHSQRTNTGRSTSVAFLNKSNLTLILTISEQDGTAAIITNIHTRQPNPRVVILDD